MRALTCVLVFTLSGCASSPVGKTLNVGIGIASVADFVTTQHGLDRGAREGNPILGQDAWRQAVIKVAGVGAVIGVASLLEKQQRPVLAHVVRVIAIAVNLSVAVHNAGVQR